MKSPKYMQSSYMRHEYMNAYTPTPQQEVAEAIVQLQPVRDKTGWVGHENTDEPRTD